MCTLCQFIEEEVKELTPLSDKEIRDYMSQIADYMDDSGADPEHFEPLLDRLLDNTMAERDSDVESDYQTKIDNQEE